MKRLVVKEKRYSRKNILFWYFFSWNLVKRIIKRFIIFHEKEYQKRMFFFLVWLIIWLYGELIWLKKKNTYSFHFLLFGILWNLWWIYMVKAKKNCNLTIAQWAMVKFQWLELQYRLISTVAHLMWIQVANTGSFP